MTVIGRTQQTGDLHISLRIRLGRVSGVRSKRHNSQAVSRNEAMRNQSIAGRIAGAHHESCALQSPKRPANHSPERSGPRIVLGVDKAPEWNDIVASHQGSASRYFQDQLCIAMIDDVENI